MLLALMLLRAPGSLADARVQQPSGWVLTPHAAGLVARNSSLLGTCLPCCDEPPPGQPCCCPGGCPGGCPGCPPLPPSCPPQQNRRDGGPHNDALMPAREAAGPWTLTTAHMAFSFDSSGAVVAIVDRTGGGGRNIVLPHGPNSSIRSSGSGSGSGSGSSSASSSGSGSSSSSSPTPQHCLLSVVFANSTGQAASSPTQVDYLKHSDSTGVATASFSNGAVVPLAINVTRDNLIVMTVLSTHGARLSGISDIIFLTTPLNVPSTAPGVAAAFDGDFAVVLLPGSLHTTVAATLNKDWSAPAAPGANAAVWSATATDCNVSSTGVILRAHVSAATGLPGRSAALWGGPRSSLDTAIQQTEATFGLPSPMIDGAWAKRAPDAHGGYFLIALTPDTLDRTIEYAVAAGMRYITFLDNIWGSSLGGHYDFDRATWGGLSGMKKAVAKINAAGLKAGMHTLSGNIMKTDRYVTPEPDPRLAKVAVNTLASDIDEHSEWLPLSQPVAGKLPSPEGPHSYSAATDCLVGSEIISYTVINGTPPPHLVRV